LRGFFPGDGEGESRCERFDGRDSAEAVFDADVERAADGEPDRLAQMPGAGVIRREPGLGFLGGYEHQIHHY
jgi:hypothetical protein